jgi:hypothetical protein
VDDVLDGLRKLNVEASVHSDRLVFSFHETKAEAEEAMAVFEDLCVQLGVLLKLSKKIAPTRNITIIGWVFDSVSHSIELSPSKRSKVIDICRDYLELKSLTLHQVQILGGNLNHAAAVIPGSSLRIQWCGRAASMAFKKRAYVLSPYDRRQLYWWIVMLADSECRVRITDPTLRHVLNIWSPRASNCSNCEIREPECGVNKHRQLPIPVIIDNLTLAR